MIWRRHGEPEVQALMQAWWAEAGRHPAGLPEVRAGRRPGGGPGTAAAEPAILPAGLGAAADNIFTARVPERRRGRRRRRRARRRRGAAGCRSPSSMPRLSPPRPRRCCAAAARRARRRARWRALRGELHQRPRRAARQRGDPVERRAEGARTPRRSRRRGRETSRSSAAGTTRLPDPEKLRATDASMTLEIRQTLDFARLWPERPAYLVTHHVNRLIPAIDAARADRLRCGYFGLAANTLRPRSLARLVDLVALDTSNVSMDWIALLPQYNAHWAVRQSKPHRRLEAVPQGLRRRPLRRGGGGGAGRRDRAPLSRRRLSVLRLRAPRRACSSSTWRGSPPPSAGRSGASPARSWPQVAARSTDAQVAAEFRAMLAELAG